MYDVVHSKVKGEDLKKMGAIKDDLELSKRVKKKLKKREALENEQESTAQTCSWCCSRSAAPAQTTGDLEIGRAGAT